MKNIYSNITWYFKRRVSQIKRLIDYFPLIWKMYDFDYRYALDLFKHQLIRTADYLESDKSLSLEAKNNAKRIRTAVKLIENVYETEVYLLEYQDTMEQLYGKNHFEFIESTELSKNGQKLYELKSWYENGVDDKDQEEIKTIEREMMIHSRNKHIKATRILWKFIGHNIAGWWD